MSKIFTRYAPSPSGQLSAGGARTALYAYCYAKKNGGKFALRVEDTNAEKSSKESLLNIMEAMEWLGIKWDVGPSIEDVKNDKYHEDHFQSKRAKTYDYEINKLLAKDLAYVGEDKCVYFRMPKRDIVVQDHITGEITFPASEQKDFIIRRADGTAIFHLANAVDDWLSHMNPLIKGADHISNGPKTVAIFGALGGEVPKFTFLPLLMDAQGQKLSKRRSDQGANILDLKREGFLPEAIVNILGLCGWSNPEKKEFFDLDYMCQTFDLKDCIKASSRYDVKKLTHINQYYIGKMGIEDFADRIEKYAKEFHPDWIQKLNASEFGLKQVCSLFQSRCKTLQDCIKMSEFLFGVEYKTEDVTKIFEKDDGYYHLAQIRNCFAEMPIWNKETIMATINKYIEQSNVKMGKISQQLRLACTGSPQSIGIDEILETIGYHKTIERINMSLSCALYIQNENL